MYRRSIVGLAVASLAVACSLAPTAPDRGAPDITAARTQASTFHTIATSDDWGNYGEQFTTFCQQKFGFDCNRADRDIGEGGLSSAQEIGIWDSEKNNPVSIVADISILFIDQAREVGVLADYEPPNASLLPAELHGPGWVATFVGVPTFIVNVDALEARGLPIPATWADLTNPAYSNPPLIGMSSPGVGASGTWSFVAMNEAAGGSVTNWQPGVEYGKRLLPNLTQQASLETFIRGEVPISIRFDFAQAPWYDDLEEQEVEYRVVVPAEGSVYAAATLMMNKYDTAHADFGKMFMEWVVTDEGQVLFSKFGARPIRSVVGENRLIVPAEMKSNWLPDENYANVKTIDWRQVDPEQILDVWTNQVVGSS